MAPTHPGIGDEVDMAEAGHEFELAERKLTVSARPSA
jgi:hypothetical protein